MIYRQTRKSRFSTYCEPLPTQDIAAIKSQHNQVNRQHYADESSFECDDNKKVMIIIAFRLYGRLTEQTSSRSSFIRRGLPLDN